MKGEDAMESIGNIIARLRRERGMTQEGLAALLGVTNSTVSKWENSTTYPDISLLPVLADVSVRASMRSMAGQRRKAA